MSDIVISKLEHTLRVTLNHNQSQEITRLFQEIRCRDGLSDDDIIALITQDKAIEKNNGKGVFLAIKQKLIAQRFPLATNHGRIAPHKVYLPPVRPALSGTIRPIVPFSPQRIYVEQGAGQDYLSQRFRALFPSALWEEIESLKKYLQQHPFRLNQLKQPALFLLREHWDFIKPCPCTAGHVSCNYWIFNLGFGCPYDCSYCFLQQYTNAPGILLPSNLDDFFNRFADFIKRFSRPIRVGTGEFCDSLALDHLTGYSTQLVDFFRHQPVLFELKTKSDNIAKLLTVAAAPNIVIAWSLNPQAVIDQEEFGAASLAARLKAAAAVQRHGYSLAFHFDPIIPAPGWEDSYQEVLELLYQHITPPVRWISLGTLRGTRALKTIAEQRFPESSIWYGELLLGRDKKLRYAQSFRKDIYRRLCQLIRKFDAKTPLYLCMEDDACWQTMSTADISSAGVEKSLLSSCP